MAAKNLPLGCFGKLPCYGDYLKVGVTEPTARALLELMLHGKQESAVDLADEGFRDVAIEGRVRILFGLPGSRELLIGVLRPSRDSGGRHFPFVAFTQIVRRTFGRHYALLPLALASVWDALEEAWDALEEAPTQEIFRETLDSIELPPLMDVTEARGDFRGRQREDSARLFEGRNGVSRANLTRGMPELLDRLRKISDLGLNVQLPVARDLEEACFNVSVWLDLLNRQFRLRRIEPSVFLDERPRVEHRLVVLRFGPPEPSDYADIVVRPRAEGFVRPAHAAGAEENEGPSDSPSTTYKDFLSARF